MPLATINQDSEKETGWFKEKEIDGNEPIVTSRPLKRSRSRFFSFVIWAATLYVTFQLIYTPATFFSALNKPSSNASNASKFAPFINSLDEINLAGNWSKKYTAEPHLAGTNYGLVEWTASKFEEYGFEATVDTYDILVSYPLDHSLKLLNAGNSSVVYEASLEEDVLKEDPTSLGDDRIPTFLGYSANGNVTAEYVYVNYGTLQDFEDLKALGVDVTGKIAIARYGKIFRGLKVKFAQDNGAVGVLIYSDPGDDFGITPANGYKQYPHGPARQESSVQRGSVQFLGGVGATPGDPTTPGYASKPGAERQDPLNSIGKIPALPISYREVKPILESLNGHGKKTDKSWHGELEGISYFTGPNKHHTLNLYNLQNFTITPLWNVYGEIKGEIEDEVIVIGNHRDAWIKGGAGDPNSGLASLLELARGFKALQDLGYVFKRSIVLASWDGEEYGLLGLTEFGEFAAKKLQKEVVAYFNMDVSVSGTNLNLQSSPVLNHVVRKALKAIEYPGKAGKTLYDHYVEYHHGSDRIGNLGSGSDYTVFLEHLGIPSIDLGFGGGKDDPVYHYHSNYDSYYWISTLADPGFVFHNVAAKFLGLAVLELNEHQTIDFKLKDYAKDLLVYYNETIDLVPKEWRHREPSQEAWDSFMEIEPEQKSYINQITQGYYRTFGTFVHPEYLEQVQCKHHRSMQMLDAKSMKKVTKLKDLVDGVYDDINNLLAVSGLFDENTELLQIEWDEKDSLHWWQRIRLYFKIKVHNKVTQYFERNFLYHHGLHERGWFKHILFASGRYTGYAGQTLPGLKEAIEDDDFDRFVKWLGILSLTLRRVSAHLN